MDKHKVQKTYKSGTKNGGTSRIAAKNGKLHFSFRKEFKQIKHKLRGKAEFVEII